MAVVAATMHLPHMPRAAPSSSSCLPNRTWPYSQPRSRSEAGPIALPSIWQVIPELDQMTAPAQKGSAYTNTNTTKRSRRTRDEEEDDEEELARAAKRVPRIYQNPETLYRQASSPGPRPAAAATAPSAPRWTSSNMTDPLRAREASRPQMTLPSLYATMGSEGDVVRAPEGRRCSPGGSGQSRAACEGTEPAYTFGSTDYDFSHHAPSCWRSHPSSPVCGYERQAPFPSGAYSLHHEVGGFGDLGAMGMGPDTKPRKRRGNLPKETTDKLRAWFAKNLRHPYPSEEQKQDLIRQTGLQMNQIANWFINARRRHLPAMLEAARKDDDASSVVKPGSGSGSSSSSSASAMASSLPTSLVSSPRSECHGLGRRRMSGVKRGSV